VNGVGKSAILEVFKLALLGEIPGKARNVDDILEFTSQPEMSVEILADMRKGTVVVERAFHRHAQSGEKRPIRINQVLRKYEEGNQWILDNLGAVSISFDPHEFLNLSSQKKRQWIIAHSPESQVMDKEVVYATGVIALMQKYFGVGLVRSLLSAYGLQTAEDLWKEDFHYGAKHFFLAGEKLNRTSSLIADLVSAFRDQDAVLSAHVLEKMDKAFSLWDDSISPEENINEILAFLKSETSSIKTLIRLKSDALSLVTGISALDSSAKGLDEQISEAQANLQSLEEQIEFLRSESAKEKQLLEAANQMERRKNTLQDFIASLNRDLAGNNSSDLREQLDILRGDLGDLKPLQKELEKHNRSLHKLSEKYRKQEMHYLSFYRDLKMKKEKLEEIGSPHFQCPVAKEIKCDTDMQCFKEGLKSEIEQLNLQDEKETETLKRTKQELWVAGKKVKEIGKIIKRHSLSNEKLQKKIESLSEKLSARESEISRARGMLKVYQEELENLLASPGSAIAGNAEELRKKEIEKRQLEESKAQCVDHLTGLLRRQGRVEANQELLRKKLRAEEEFDILKWLTEIFGPEGIQKNIASRAAEGLEEETNALLQWMDERYTFTLDLTGKKFQMGWNREGKVIPFTTINSAHFILFIVPFLTALLNRLARVRERVGKPTLKALCVEAESMTPDNLEVLLHGLSIMKRHGYLDNVLVAHYSSIRDRRKLSGFKETILRDEGDQTVEEVRTFSPVLAGSAG
ncbi:MAG: hypothetical protein ACE5EK_00770, partial [Nitrospinales bacterium]